MFSSSQKINQQLFLLLCELGSKRSKNAPIKIKKPYLIKITTVYPFKIIFSGSSGGLPSQLLLFFLHFSVEFPSCPLWFVSVQWLLDHLQCVTWIQICCVGWAVGRDFGIEVWVQGGGERGTEHAPGLAVWKARLPSPAMILHVKFGSVCQRSRCLLPERV